MIGRIEKISLPELGLFSVVAKIDTGAYRGALHCHKIDVVEREGKNVVAFFLLDESHPEYQHKEMIAHEFRYMSVLSSNGHRTRRIIIKTPLVLGGETFLVEITLSDRNEMKHPFLIGRRALKRFLIDPSLKNI